MHCEKIAPYPTRLYRGIGTAVLIALCALPSSRCQSTYIFGDPGWFAIGDTIQFMGDSQQSTVQTAECSWDEPCYIDKGLTFRKVENANLSTCSADELPSDTCYVCAVVCCFFFGDCGGDRQGMCEGGGVPHDCWETADECGEYCLCKSLFEVTGYNSAPGDREYVCYGISLICISDEDCEDGLAGCDVVRKWF